MKRFVEDFAGFNFTANPFQEKTHLFTSLEGVLVCTSPEEGDRFKYQEVLRDATSQEATWYIENLREMRNSHKVEIEKW